MYRVESGHRLAVPVRLILFVLICVAVIFLALLTVSLALGTTELGGTPAQVATVHTWAARLMWVGVGAAVMYLARDLFMWLMHQLEL